MEDIRIICVLVSLLPIIFGYTGAGTEPNAIDPVIRSSEQNEHGVPLFRGQIHEDESTVDLRPGLLADDQDSIGGARLICEYHILRSKKRGRLPFVIHLKNKTTGAAKIRVHENETLSIKKRSHYKFDIIAKDCGTPPRLSAPAIVLIKVLKANDFAPVFDNSSYIATVKEGKMYPNILSVHASDGDLNRICGYEILTPEAPFAIDSRGNIRNTEPLDYSFHRNYILKVVARDCGQKLSRPVFVNIVVEELCRSGWQDIPDHIQYIARSGRQNIAKKARLQLCEEGCTPEKIAVRITLATKHIGKGCDRDTYSITSQRKLCGASGESVDLLPSPSLAAWTRNLPTDDGHESDQVFSFDGQTNAVEVPDVHFNHTLHEHFTISTWMKHEPQGTYTSQHRAPKEHILCMSDGEHMSRHHYSIFVHGEKLVFLLRREATSVEEMEIFKPAEWRWHIPQINDGEWHHYAISVNFPDVQMFIDGKLLIPDKTNLEIVDDWPLHSSHKVHYTKLTVGACWQGGENHFAHHFRGFLAGLSVLKHKSESDRVIKCLNNCKENLDFHDLGDMLSGTKVSFNSEMTEFSISGHDVSEVEKLMKEVTYVNARSYPTPGRRNLKVETSIVCNGSPVELPTVESYVMVQEPPKPVITIGGDTNLTRLIYQFERGLRVFQDVHIYASQEVEEEEEDSMEDDVEDKASKLAYKLSKSMVHQSTDAKTDLKDGLLLDSCDIDAEPPLELEYEHLSLPTHMMENLGLEWSETNSGLTITNADKMERYIGVIRNIHYYHNRPTFLNSRTLTLSCSSQNERFVSNRFTVKLVAVHEIPKVQSHANSGVEKPVRVEQGLNVHSAGMATVAANTSNFGMAAIIVVCVGFLLFMIILGVIRIRAAHRRTQVVQVDEKCEMEWDNSALNITVNPMEQEQVFDYEDNGMQSLRDESDSDDDGSSFHDDGESSDEEPPKAAPTVGQDLEWDHSNLGF